MGFKIKLRTDSGAIMVALEHMFGQLTDLNVSIETEWMSKKNILTDTEQ